MKQKIDKVEQITDERWINLFHIVYHNSKEKICHWVFASRKKSPFEDNSLDAVVIVPFMNTSEGRKIVVTKEYRATIDGYEYGFPAGLIDEGEPPVSSAKRELTEETGLIVKRILGKSNKIVSSAGLSDETTVMYFVEAEGSITTENQEDVEDIETLLYSQEDVKKLLASDEKIGAKAWGVLYYFSKTGNIQ